MKPQPAGAARLVDIVLVSMVVDFLWLWSRRGFQPRSVAGPLIAVAPGACLALALRSAVGGASPFATAGALAAALPFHLADLARRPVS